jgi:hypothetical protein
MRKLQRTLATSFVLVAAASCGKSIDSGDSGGRATDIGGSAGTGGRVTNPAGSSGVDGGSGGGGGTACAERTCPDPADLGLAALVRLDIPGVGQVWPRPAQIRGQGGVGSGDSAPASGCTISDDPYSTDPAAACHGHATLNLLLEGAREGDFEVTYADGSVARLAAIHAAPPVAEASIDVSVSTYWNPDEGSSPISDVSGRTLAGAELWIRKYNLSLDEARVFFGAEVTEAESCAAEHVFDHVVHSVPEQRIAAGQIETVQAAQGTYDVAWYRSAPVPATCGAYARDIFSAVLIAE